MYSGWQGGYGQVVIIDHGGGYRTLYAHCSKLNVVKNQKVSRGQTVALVGSTGNSTGPHLHFEVRVNNKHQNPRKYVPIYYLNSLSSYIIIIINLFCSHLHIIIILF